MGPTRRTSHTFVLAGLAIGLMALTLASPASAASGTWERAWGKNVNGGGVFGICTVASSCLAGTTGGLGGEFNDPQGDATDSAGNVYVADTSNNRIEKFDSSGNFLRAWGRDVVSTGPDNTMGGDFEICVAANGDVCKTGSTTAPALGGVMSGPNDVATDSSGNVYVADSSFYRVQRFDSFGNFQRAWGFDVASAGPGNTGTNYEVCVAADGDTCKTGTTTTPALGGVMSVPGGIATDTAGNVYVADSGFHRVQKFDSFGGFQRAWGKDVVGAGPGDTGTGVEICVAANGDTCKTGVSTPPALGGVMATPPKVATDAAGNVYVADRNFQRVQKFDSSGNFQRAWGKDVVSAGPGDTGTGFEICVAANGDTCKNGLSGGLAGEMFQPSGVATDPGGNVYVADSGYHRVDRFDSSGNFQRAWGKDVVSAGPGNTGVGLEICVPANGDACKVGTNATALGGEMNVPYDVATNVAGDLYVVDEFNNRIQKFADPIPPPPPGGGGGGGGGSSAPAPTLAAGPTGLRAAALKKCKKKHGAARARCKKKANLLPV